MILDSPLFKIAGVDDYIEMEDYLLANDFEAKPTSRVSAQYHQFQCTTVPEIKINWKTVPFVIAVHPETGKWYIPGTARYGQGLPSLQRTVKKFTVDTPPVESVAPEDENKATEEMQKLIDMAQVQNSALEPRGFNNSRRETYRDINNTHNRSIRFLNKTLKEFGFGDYEVWKGEKHMGSSKETYIRYNPFKTSFGFTTKGYERTPKYHSYTRYAGDYGMVEPADLAAMIASHRGYDKKYPELYQQIIAKTRLQNDSSWYEWNVNATKSAKVGSLSIIARLKKNVLSGEIVPKDSDEAVEKKTEQLEPATENKTELGGDTVDTEPPNQNAVREAVQTSHDYEIGKSIEEKENEVGTGNNEDVTGDGKVKITKTPTQITINIGV
jgi:hypothetical protein